MIPCTEKCVYQKEGVCELEQAASSGDSGGTCRNRVRSAASPPKRSSPTA
jgi:hypothetical protein